MKANGWKGDPIGVVKMPGGKLTTIDNTRVAVAREVGIEVQATIRNYKDPLPTNLIDRFTTKKEYLKLGRSSRLKNSKAKD